MFKPNEGKLDRVVRLVGGATAILAGVVLFTGLVQVLLVVLGLVAVVTGITGFCGLYALLGINTCEVKKK